MFKKSVICPSCGVKFSPYGAFMLEKCYCPQCGKCFYVIKGARLILFLYSIAAFTALLTVYNTIRPETSIVIALFWTVAMVLLRVITYITHYFLLVTWTMWHKLSEK